MFHVIGGRVIGLGRAPDLRPPRSSCRVSDVSDGDDSSSPTTVDRLARGTFPLCLSVFSFLPSDSDQRRPPAPGPSGPRPPAPSLPLRRWYDPNAGGLFAWERRISSEVKSNRMFYSVVLRSHWLCVIMRSVGLTDTHKHTRACARTHAHTLLKSHT